MHLPPSAESLGGKESLPQQKLAELMAVPQQIHLRIVTGPTEIAQRFVRFIRNPHRGQIATAQQSGQVQRIAAVRLDALTRLAGDQTRSSHDAGRAHASEVSVQPIATRACLVTERETCRRAQAFASASS